MEVAGVVIEIELPNNQCVIEDALATCIRATNGRHAEAGEFTSRSFFNGNISLYQAEGVCATISSRNDSELLGAAKLRGGALHELVLPVSIELRTLLALVESGIDFVDEEEVTAIDDAELSARLHASIDSIQQLLTGSIAMEQLRNLPTVVLAGLPNAGKSSLFNALVKRTRVVVSGQSGTTRDVIKEPVWFGKTEAILVDVAGIENATTSIEHDAQKKAERSMQDADLVVWCVAPNSESPPPSPNTLIVHTKSDVCTDSSSNAVSAHTSEGIDALCSTIEGTLQGAHSGNAAAIALFPRHIAYLQQTESALQNAMHVRNTPELVASSIREALNAVGKITGEVTPDEILGEVFSTFCIGK